MARTVLAGAVKVWTIPAIAALCALGACAPLAPQAFASATPEAIACSGDLSGASTALQNQFPSFKQRIETGPVYRTLVQRIGPPRDCQRTTASGVLHLRYSFPKGATLTAQIDSRIEFFEERVDFSAFTQSEAKELLKAAEKHAFGANGCGIAWKETDAEESHSSSGLQETIYRGDVCNCQARVLSNGGRISAIILRSAC
jgi:hypothetical protein